MNKFAMGAGVFAVVCAVISFALRDLPPIAWLGMIGGLLGAFVIGAQYALRFGR